ncbi:MAG: hypothetical protein ABIC40_00180 [bacterium]
MKTNLFKLNTRWTLIAVIAIVLLLTAGTIYAQGVGRNRQGDQGGRGQGMMGPGRDGGMGGVAGMGGMAVLMQDEEIRGLMFKIHTIAQFNEIDLSADQAKELIKLARDARGILDENFNEAKGEVKSELDAQLKNVLAGNEPDRDVFKGIRDKFQSEHEPGAIRDELSGIIDNAENILTDEQKQKLMESKWAEMGPGGPGGNPDGQMGNGQMGNGQMGQRMGRRFNNMSDQDKENLRNRFQERMGDMQANRAKMRVARWLMSPNAIETLELYINANK